MRAFTIAMEKESSDAAPPNAAEPPAQESAHRKDVKKPLILFAVLSFLGIIILLISVVAGLVILVVAEGFFAFAYRRFSRRPQKSAERRASP